MSDIFISYARSTAADAQRVAEALRAAGYDVWRDDELPAHRAYSEVIEERLEAAKAVVVLWSAEATRSHWVRAEADAAREAGTLVQVRLDEAALPMPFNQIQCADLVGWKGDPAAPGWRKALASIADLAPAAAPPKEAKARRPEGIAICVLPFANISDDPQQEYFSDGISEDIITDLSKVSALAVASRNTAFAFKGRTIDVRRIGAELGVSHVLEGSVRKAGNRVRITAQLIEAATDTHLWADRWDRDLTDIFALQDEVSQAIVAALRLRLLPEEKRAIEQRGTSSPEAYDLFLLARQRYIIGNRGDVRGTEAITRLCRRATEIDPTYARAWALMALAQTWLFFYGVDVEENGLAAAERALALDPDLAEAHAVRAKHLHEQGRGEEAAREIEIALRQDPESREVNECAGDLSFRSGDLPAAARYYERAAALMDTDFGSCGMLITTYGGLGDVEGARRAAQMTLSRAEAAVAKDQSNGSAMGFLAVALAELGESGRSREWMDRALLIDPDNENMRYNFACSLSRSGSVDEALSLLGPFFAATSMTYVNHARIDPDLDRVRGDPRFQAMLADAQSRLSDSAGRNERKR